MLWFKVEVKFKDRIKVNFGVRVTVGFTLRVMLRVSVVAATATSMHSCAAIAAMRSSY